jgi:hypothetical protein
MEAFDYADARDVCRRTLEILHQLKTDTRTITATLHGVGFGFDEVEILKSEIAGFAEAFRAGKVPLGLEKITIVERHPYRAEQLRNALPRLLPKGGIQYQHRDPVESAEIESGASLPSIRFMNPHVFVALPPVVEMNDVFHYAIRPPVTAAGLLCERADLSYPAASASNWARNRIQDATLFLADLTGRHPNVFLHLGYAWSQSCPTLLLLHINETPGLDISESRCVRYNTIRDLEEMLSDELQEHRAKERAATEL